jgi:hypothetical protein
MTRRVHELADVVARVRLWPPPFDDRTDSKLMAALRVRDFDMPRRRVNVSRSVRNLGAAAAQPITG